MLTNSTAILADAVHDLGDTLSIALGWLLQRMGGRPAGSEFTSGYQRLSLLGALINALILIVGSVIDVHHLHTVVSGRGALHADGPPGA